LLWDFCWPRWPVQSRRPLHIPRIDHPTMLAAFHAIAKTGLPCAIHNEDQELVEKLTAEARAAGRTDPIMHCRTRPPLADSPGAPGAVPNAARARSAKTTPVRGVRRLRRSGTGTRLRADGRGGRR